MLLSANIPLIQPKKAWFSFTIVFFIATLSACGSSSSSSSSASAPVVPVVTPQPVTPNPTQSAIQTPHEIVASMGIGTNMGNTLDAPNEGDWALAAQEYYFDAYKRAGFKHVRIPITWANHVSNQSPYEIDPAFLDRVEQIVDWALERDLYVVINAHHESWLKNDFNQSKQDRFIAIWDQVSRRMQNKSLKLLFEILNEPNGMTVSQVDSLNTEVLNTIRADNPARAVIYSGNGFTPADSLLAAAIPNDENIIANFHSYDPWPFAGQCQISWGSDADKQALREIYERVDTWAQNVDLAVTINEFSAALYDFQQPSNICDPSQRLAYIKHHVELQKEFGFAGAVWDDGGSFQIYDRANDTFSNALSSLVF